MKGAFAACMTVIHSSSPQDQLIELCDQRPDRQVPAFALEGLVRFCPAMPARFWREGFSSTLAPITADVLTQEVEAVFDAA